jgi:hypothetical protein
MRGIPEVRTLHSVSGNFDMIASSRRRRSRDLDAV